MFSQPLTYAELVGLGVAVCGILLAAGLATGILARRKGYDSGLWGVAGAFLVGWVALAFLKSADDADSPDDQGRRRRTGNRIAGCLAVAALLISLSASFGTNPDERELRRFVAEKLPHARDGRVAKMMAVDGFRTDDLKIESYGVYCTARVPARGGGRVKVIGFWGAWWAAGEDR
jgi:hypothetical protein